MNSYHHITIKKKNEDEMISPIFLIIAFAYHVRVFLEKDHLDILPDIF